MVSEKLVLSPADYTVVAVCLCVSTAIGFYFQFSSSKRKTNEEFLLAGRNMAILPVSCSLLATFMSSTNYMGLPADIYRYGTNMAFMNLGFIAGSLLSAYLFLPIFFNNGFATAYEYLEERFGFLIRRVTSAMFVIQSVLYSSVALYAPALAISAVTDLSISFSIVAMGSVCTLYCTIGGMKAVLWTDAFQALLMYTALLAVITTGSMSVGGLGSILTLSYEGGRLVFPSFKFDLKKQYTIYNVFSQGLIISLSMLSSQLSVQRYMTIKSLERARCANLLFIPMVVIFQLLSCTCGLTIYAYFLTCDPMTSPDKPIDSSDQLLPYFVTRVMGHLPGLPGLCVAGVFSASLSTVSSSVNSLVAVTYEDFFLPLIPASGNRPLLCTKLTSIFYGCLCIGFAFLASSLGSLMKMSLSILGMFAGPNLAVFLLAACTTTANQEGVLIGLISSLVVGVWLVFNPNSKLDPPLPVSNECPLLESRAFLNDSTFIPNQDGNVTSFTHEEEPFYVGYMWIAGIGLVICFVISYSGSVAVNLFRGKTSYVPEIYLAPARNWFHKEKLVSKNEVTIQKTNANIKPNSSRDRYVFSSIRLNDSNL